MTINVNHARSTVTLLRAQPSSVQSAQPVTFQTEIEQPAVCFLEFWGLSFKVCQDYAIDEDKRLRLLYDMISE